MAWSWAQSKSKSAGNLCIIISAALASSILTWLLTGSRDLHGFPRLMTSSPNTKTHTTVFQDQERNASFGPSLWGNLVPSNGGFIRIDSDYLKDSEFMKENGKQLEAWRTRKVGISMFHQLHCLEMLKDRMTMIYRGGKMEFHGAGHGHIVPRMMTGDDEEGSEEDVAVKHLFHCLDYVAQGVLCAADDTLEPATDGTGNVDGANFEHTCRDSRRLYEAAEA